MAIHHIHRLVGNAITENLYIIVGMGLTQLFQAVLYALFPSDAAKPMGVVSAVPYYSSYPMKIDFLQSRLYRWAGEANTFKAIHILRLYANPNNADGLISRVVLNSENGKTIYNLTYYWPQGDHDIILFTVSKATSYAGSRLGYNVCLLYMIGWAIIKDVNIAKKITKFIEMNTIRVFKDSQLRAMKIMKVVSDSYELPDSKPNARLFNYGRKVLAARWEILKEVVMTKPFGNLYLLPGENYEHTC